MTPFGARRSRSLGRVKGPSGPAAPSMVRIREGKQEHVFQHPHWLLLPFWVDWCNIAQLTSRAVTVHPAQTPGAPWVLER